jgi:1,4-dihydroxy-2-naphthoate octaprenyltransferase
MDFEKLETKIEAAEVVEGLVLLANNIFDKNSDDVKKTIEMLITSSYLMGKKNAVKTFD